MKITLIAALTEDNVIGQNGDIPWNIPEDQKHFYNQTFGHPVIMGRKTFENIVNKLGNPLEGRLNIVMTRSKNYDFRMTVPAQNKEEGLKEAETCITDEVFIAGGESIYKEFIDDADRMILTWVKENFDGDSYFPNFYMDEWRMVSQRITNDYSIIEYERRT